MTKKSKIQIIVAKDKTGDFYKLRDGKVVQKNTIVNQMKEGQHYNDAKGSKVSFERINGQNYLRAVHDESKIDNLKNLPIFDRHKTHHEAKKSKIQIIVAKDKTGDFYKLRDGKVVHKETIVKQMEAGQHYNDAKGSKVSFERINGQNYLRAVHDESKIDNLKNLPIFDRHKTHHEDVSHPTTTHTHYHLPLTTFDTTSNTRRVSERLGTLGYLAIGFALLALVLCLLFGFLFEMRTSSGTSITPRASSSVLDFSTVTQGLFLFGWTVYSNGTYSITWGISAVGWIVIALLIVALILNVVYFLKENMAVEKNKIILTSVVVIVVLFLVTGVFLFKFINWIYLNPRPSSKIALGLIAPKVRGE